MKHRVTTMRMNMKGELEETSLVPKKERIRKTKMILAGYKKQVEYYEKLLDAEINDKEFIDL